jgi:hypothetical protein
MASQRTAPPSRAISSTQGRRPGSPSEGITVAGQRRSLTGLRYSYVASASDQGTVTIGKVREERQA